MGSFQTAFVAGHKNEVWWGPAIFLVMLCIGVYFVWRYRGQRGVRLLIGWGFLLIGLAGPVLAISTLYNVHRYLKSLRTRQYDVVEGKVTDFHPMPRQGHSLESFRVENIKFSYSDYDVSYCFNQTASHGGPIREGLNVRIAHLDNCILKLEIKNP